MRIIYLSILLLLIRVQFITAQDIQWQNTIGGSGQDLLSTICETNDGGYLIGGSSNSNISGDKTEDSKGAEDFWILKLDSIGNILWQKTIGGNAWDGIGSIIQTLDNGFLLSGGSSSNISGDKTEDSQGASDFWIVKIDDSGNIQWQNTIGGSLGESAFVSRQTSDGGYIVGGNSFSNISGDKTENSRGDSDYWILKLDSIGNIQWQKTIGGNGFDYLSGLVLSPDGGYIMAGLSDSNISGDKTENSNGGPDFWIVKIDSSGTIQWQNTIGGSGEETNPFIDITTNGNYILSGSSRSVISGDKTEDPVGIRNYWILIIDSFGNIISQKTVGGNKVDDVRDNTSTIDGGSLHIGYSNSDLYGDKSENSRGGFWGDYWAVKLDSLGHIIWQNTIGGSDDDIPNAIIETSDQGCVIAGSSSSNVSEDKSENSQGNYDFWVVKLSSRRNNIRGSLFADLNLNNINDPGEISVNGKKILEINSGKFAFTQSDGFYSIALPDTGMFQVYPDFFNSYYNYSPLFHDAYFSTYNVIDSLNDFAFQPIGIFNDLCIKLNPRLNFRSGFDASYAINYSNQGTSSLVPTVIFYPDSLITFVSSNPAPFSVTPDSIIWYIGNLNPWESGEILVTVNVISGLPLGTLINSNAIIEPIVGDANSICNQSYWEVFTTGSADPNDIIVNKEILTTDQVFQGEYLEYIVRFQNTGNDTAFFVNILNPIDTNVFDLNSFEYIDASSQVNLNWLSWERNMKFTFDNILLPDSITNEQLSHGFIRYRIKPKQALIAGDSIINFAAIFFDYNYPVITNVVHTTIVLPTSLNDQINKSISIFPNPFVNEITINLSKFSNQNVLIELNNVYGQRVNNIYSGEIINGNLIKKFDVSSLPKGVYLLTIKGKVLATQKIIKL